MNGIYLDYNATTPVDREVADMMIPVLRENFGNPSSSHSFGINAKKVVETARSRVATLINAGSHEIIFTSGGTESNNIAIRGIAFSSLHRGKHIITSRIEHPSVLEVCRALEEEGFRISYVGVDSKGRVDPEEVRSEIQADTILITIMHANNETGTIQPIKEIAMIAKEAGIPFHTDAAQSAGKIEINVRESGIDLLSLAGHKFYAPKGVGALFIREGVRLRRIMQGAAHERNLRPGTENVPEIAGLGRAAEIASRDLQKNAELMKQCRDLLYQELKRSLPFIIWNGDQEHILPNTLNITFPGINSGTLLSELSDIAVSAGAACHSENTEISHVLKAMDIPPGLAMGTIRFSTGKYTDPDDIRKASEMIVHTVLKLTDHPEKAASSIDETTKVRLTRYTHGMGCACKLSPSLLHAVIKEFPVFSHPDIIVGSETADDAAVFRLNDDQAIVQTVDFFTPVVDDPFDFGAIAASNALSDIYAMGARPLFALNILAFPVNRLPLSVLRDILSGARSVTDEAGIQILGGHTIEDNEPKFGMVVSGLVHPARVIKNSTAAAGHRLILTKPLGTGILSTALKRGLLAPEDQKSLISCMRKLNRSACEQMIRYNVSSCTDVTGFGLSGHLKEMIEASGKGAEIKASDIPLLPGALDFVAQGIIPGGTRNNIEFTKDILNYDEGIDPAFRILFSDAQTSGGLLITVSPEDAESLMNDLIATGNDSARIIGVISDEHKGFIKIRP